VGGTTLYSRRQRFGVIARYGSTLVQTPASGALQGHKLCEFSSLSGNFGRLNSLSPTGSQHSNGDFGSPSVSPARGTFLMVLFADAKTS
jgi:hypothetical protein